jgi:hypothetical protein
VVFRLGMIVFSNTVCSILDERHEVQVILALDDENALTSVPVP